MSAKADKALRWSRRLSHVPRWAVAPVIKQQNVGEHCFHSARIAQWLMDVHAEAHRKHYPVEMELAILKKALEHDDDEAADGDVPSPSKPPKDYSTWSELRVFVKVCDLLEAALFLREEQLFGNRRVDDLVVDIDRRLEEAWAYFRYNGQPSNISLISLKIRLPEVLFGSHPALENPNG